MPPATTLAAALYPCHLVAVVTSTTSAIQSGILTCFLGSYDSDKQGGALSEHDHIGDVETTLAHIVGAGHGGYSGVSIVVAELRAQVLSVAPEDSPLGRAVLCCIRARVDVD